jgi:septin family protein
VRGKQVLGRKYPTGIHEIENPDHSDFSRLKTLIVTHMQDMRDVTHEVHYENFRAQRIQSGYGMQQNKWKASAVLETSIDDENFDSISTCTSQFSVERERQLREKEIELQKMAEKIKLYEEQMKIQQQMFQQKQLQHHDE